MSNFYYLDTSAFIKRYMEEMGSEAVRNLLKKKEQFFISKIAYVELLMTFSRKKNEGMISNEELIRWIDRFRKDWLALNIVELSNEILKTLEEKVSKYALKAPDAIHLSSALWLNNRLTNNVIFVCADNALKKKAALEGLNIWDPIEIEQGTQDKGKNGRQ